MRTPHVLLRWAALVAALAALNAAVTFYNVWPTPKIRWEGDLSIELALCLLLLLLTRRWHAAWPRGTAWALAGLWFALTVGRYADVTARALFGRRMNAYWDLPHVSNVAGMFLEATPAATRAGIVAGTVAGLVALLLVLRWAFGRVVSGLQVEGTRRALVAVTAAALLFFAGQRVSPSVPREPAFTAPVSQTYAVQAQLIVEAVRATSGVQVLPAGPPMVTDLRRAPGADVLLLFLESYGAITYDRPAFAEGLADSRQRFADAVAGTGRQVVSAFVESPTFGGGSWLAHISLMSGLEVRTEYTNALLMTQQRDTLPSAFARNGYRTIAVMPGLQQQWPEGRFYGFDRIYDRDAMGYLGPEFGWWGVPDQYSMATLDAIELAPAARRPLFVFYPLINTHAPFAPTPPYQPDWSRMTGEAPFDEEAVSLAFDDWADWENLSPGYVRSVSYEFRMLAGYLEAHPERNLVIVLLGDHQPPAAVTGAGQSWNVPVHVVATQPDLLDRLRAAGFVDGMEPPRPEISPMHELLPTLLDALGDPVTTTTPAR